MKAQFYPKWLKNEIEIKQKKQLKNLVVLFIAFMLISSINIKNGLKEIKELRENKVGFAELTKEEEPFIAVKKFNYLCEVLNENQIVIKGLSILKDTIHLEIYATTIKEYSLMIKILEEGFQIEEISPLIFEDEKGYFKVRMKNYELT